MFMKKGTWPYTSTEILYISDKDLLEIFKGYSINGKSYGQSCIEYKNTIYGLISNCKEDQVILVHIHADFPQKKEDFAIVYKNSHSYKVLNQTDDYTIIVDINEHYEILKNLV